MSVREVKSLSNNKIIASRTRSGRQDDRSRLNMSSQEEISDGLEAQVSQLEQTLASKEEEVSLLRSDLRKVTREVEHANRLVEAETAQVNALRQELETEAMRGELTMLRALDNLRTEHQVVLDREREAKAKEQERIDELLQSMKKQHQQETASLLKQIAKLKKQLVRVRERPSQEGLSSSSESGDTEDSPASDVKTPSGTGSKSSPPDKTITSMERSEVIVTVSTPVLTGPTKVVTSSVTSDTVLTPNPSDVPKVVTSIQPSEGTKTAPTLDSSSAVTTAMGTTRSSTSVSTSPGATRSSTSVSTSPGATRPSTSVSTSLGPPAPTGTTTPAVTVLSPAAPVFVPASSVPTPTRTGGPSAPVLRPPAMVTMTTPRGIPGGPGPPTDVMSGTVMETFSRFLKVQTDAIAAQAKATAVRNLPALATYSGENEDVDGDGFERWLEMFKERAAFAGWSDAEQLYQLKLHLTRNALEIFRMLPSEEQATIAAATSGLRKRLKPADIEELRGLEFHHRTQGVDETIEQLGVSIQRLGRKAFPSITGRDFDRLLKGRFYQALMVRWQRKLGCPKPEEGFHDLFTRARMLEEQEKQFAASAISRQDTNTRPRKSNTSHKDKPKQPEKSPSTSASPNPSSQVPKVQCYKCKKPGHLRKDCPLKAEAPGRSPTGTNAGVSSTDGTSVRVDDLTVTQLEKLLADRRLTLEKEGLAGGSATNVVLSSAAQAVGNLCYTEVYIEGLLVEAMVDTGAQSTIISRTLLHAINHHVKQQGRELPPLELPSARLYGKDGEKGGQELLITAQVNLVVSLGDHSVTVPIFVQPDSKQSCLLGINAIPLLGIQVSKPNGDSLLTLVPSLSDVSEISLIKAAAIPAQNGCIVRAKVSPPLPSSKPLLFEPDHASLEPLGIAAFESVLESTDGNHVLLVLENYSGMVAHVEPNVLLGKVRCTMATEIESEQPFDDKALGCVAPIKSVEYTADRLTKLYAELQLPPDLPPNHVRQLKTLIAEHHDVFALDNSELGCTSVLRHSIDTGDHRPLKLQPYRTPVVRRRTMSEMIESMEKNGIVQPSASAWASPVVLVPKKDGSMRFCIDYHRLNAITRKDVYPLPRVDDIFDTLGGARYFTTLDLASGYWQVELDDEASSKSAFTTYKGLYEFTRMPFGLCNAPATFQRLMHRVLAGLEWQSCFAYLDDVLVASKTFEDHLRDLGEVLRCLKGAGLRLKPKKCQFLRAEVPFLGHIISQRGIKPDPLKTQKVKNYPPPLDVPGVRRFLGLASYYRRFIPGFAQIASPLHALTKKNVAFHWTTGCERAFEQLKDKLVSAPVLVFPKFGPDCSFILETDASATGLGAILSQTQTDGTTHPVAYASRSLDKHERNYGISELETLGLVWAVRYFRQYLLGHPCVVYTDHSACLSILNTPKPSGKLARWALTIQEMDLTIRHKPGRQNSNADALSRCPADESQNQVCVVNTVEGDDLPSVPGLKLVADQQAKDHDMALMLAYL